MKTYPSGTVRALIGTDLVTPPTREALQARLMPAQGAPQFFEAQDYAILRAVCARLIPQPDRAAPIEVAPAIDERLAQRKGKGWRYDVLPADGETYRRALRGLDQSARARHSLAFIERDAAQ